LKPKTINAAYMEIPMNKLQECVNKGAELLDEKNPGWHNEIDISSLSMNSDCHCVVGQLYNDYWDGLKELDIESPFNLRFVYGFNTKSCWGTIEELGQAWTYKILSKRKQYDN